MALTFRQVRHFIATAETGRVSAAAAGLNVTPSAVTASLKARSRSRTKIVRPAFERRHTHSPRRLWTCANHPLLHKDSVRLIPSDCKNLHAGCARRDPFYLCTFLPTPVERVDVCSKFGRARSDQCPLSGASRKTFARPSARITGFGNFRLWQAPNEWTRPPRSRHVRC
jgi:hypothetical protein